jgi:hypothetical protein
MSIPVAQVGAYLGLAHEIRWEGCKFCIEHSDGTIHMWSILTGWHTSSHSWTGVRVHRMMRRGIMAARRAAKLLVDVIGRACSAGTLWAVRRWHGGPIHVTHMGRTTKLTHRARRRLLRVAV